MGHRTYRDKGFSITLPEAWEDVTESLENPEAPLTFANSTSGVGALQVSTAVYQHGRLPRVRAADLSELLGDFACRQGWGDSFDRSTTSGEVAVEGASFQSSGDLVRVWYVSDGEDIIMATYVSVWELRDREVTEREAIVRSIRFGKPKGF